MYKDGKGKELPLFADNSIKYMETMESTGTFTTKFNNVVK